jgi:hypothetical protein
MIIAEPVYNFLVGCFLIVLAELSTLALIGLIVVVQRLKGDW